MPSSSPSDPIRPVPPQLGCAGAGRTGHDHAVPGARMPRVAERDRGDVERVQGLHEPQARRLVDAEDVAGHDLAAAGHQRDVARFRDQIADGENHARVADQHAAAGPFRPEHAGREGVLGDLGLERDDGGQGLVEIERVVAGAGPGLRGNAPLVVVGQGSSHFKARGACRTRRPPLQGLPAIRRTSGNTAISSGRIGSGTAIRAIRSAMECRCLC